MNRVAEKAGVIKQAIYSHFCDKEGLFKAIVENLTIGQFKVQFGEKIDSDQPPEVVLRKIGAILAGRQKDKYYIALMRTVIGESSRFPELARLFTEVVIKPSIGALAAYFRAHPELDIEDGEAVARIYCGTLVHFIMVQEVLFGKELLPFEIDRLIECLIAMVLHKPVTSTVCVTARAVLPAVVLGIGFVRLHEL